MALKPFNTDHASAFVLDSVTACEAYDRGIFRAALVFGQNPVLIKWR